MMRWTRQKTIKVTPKERVLFELEIPDGLIGMNELTRFHGVVEKDMPFIELRSLDEDHLGFWVMDPFLFVDSYEVEVSDEDVNGLGITDPEQALFLCLATINKSNVTLNLMAPLLIHRETQKGKQVVLENYKHYSARHIIYEGAVTCLS